VIVATSPAASRLGDPGAWTTGLPAGSRSRTVSGVTVAGFTRALKVIIGRVEGATFVAPASGVTETTMRLRRGSTLKTALAPPRERSPFLTSTRFAPVAAVSATEAVAESCVHESRVEGPTVMPGSGNSAFAPAAKFAPRTISAADAPCSALEGSIDVTTGVGIPISSSEYSSLSTPAVV
jgi:hypothetical protein